MKKLLLFLFFYLSISEAQVQAQNINESEKIIKRIIFNEEFIVQKRNNSRRKNYRESRYRSKYDDAKNYDDSDIIIYFLIGSIIVSIIILFYNQQKKKSPDSGPLLFKASIEGFIEKMKKIPDWYKIIQARGNGHAMMVNAGIKVDDYEYWANVHKEEYITKYNNGDLDVEGITLRIEKFSFIVSEFEKVIKKASELSLNITTEMANDYHAARASVLGAEKALEEMNDESEDKVEEIEEKQIKNKFCTNCGTSTLGNNKFCTSCGNKLM